MNDSPHILKCDPAALAAAYRPRGGCEALIYSHDPEVILSGPAETGKTLAACWKLHLICSKYPGTQAAIVRKTYKAIAGSVAQTFERVIAGFPVERYGGERVEHYSYPNNSRIWLGGMDNPDKVLSSERSVIYCNQAEELSIDDWEKLCTRCTGRGAVIPYPQIFGDCNPSGTQHWIRMRAAARRLTLMQSMHKDNPTLYDEAGNLTEQGRRTMAALESLTGVRRQRLLLGQWSTAEGAVYDMFDRNIHVLHRDREEFVRFFLAMDAGYTHPAVILLVGEDNDGRWHILWAFYQRSVLQENLVAQAKEQWLAYHVETIACDEAAAGLIADLRNKMGSADIRAAKGDVFSGIQAIQNRLKVQGDGKPRLTVEPDIDPNVVNEFESYEWMSERDKPKKENDHAMDAIRYLQAAIDIGKMPQLNILWQPETPAVDRKGDGSEWIKAHLTRAQAAADKIRAERGEAPGTYPA
jgi:PBSX family phage terminase large subunit